MEETDCAGTSHWQNSSPESGFLENFPPNIRAQNWKYLPLSRETEKKNPKLPELPPLAFSELKVGRTLKEAGRRQG